MSQLTDLATAQGNRAGPLRDIVAAVASRNGDGTDPSDTPPAPWPPAHANFALTADRRTTAVLLDRISDGAAAHARDDGLFLELGVSVSGPSGSVAAARAALTDLDPATSRAAQATWIRLGDPAAASLEMELLSEPRPAGLVVEAALRAEGNLSAIPELLRALGGEPSIERAFAPWLTALEDEQVRLRPSRSHGRSA